MLISVFVTNGCNMKCSYCYEGLLKDKSSFDSNRSLNIIFKRDTC